MPNKSNSYFLYREACDLYDVECVSEKEYDSIMQEACLKLGKEEITVDKCPYIIYNINSMRVKFKRVSKENVQVNFFSEDQYKTIVSKYKEDN